MDICIKGTQNGYQIGNGWGLKGWECLNNKMKLAGLDFTTEQMKNMWDWMKVMWQL